MFKLIILFLSLSTYGAVSESKVDYLVDLLKLEQRYPSLIERVMELGIKDHKELALVKSDYLEHLKKYKTWSKSKEIVIKLFFEVLL